MGGDCEGRGRIMMSEDRFAVEDEMLARKIHLENYNFCLNHEPGLSVVVNLDKYFPGVWYKIKFYLLDRFPERKPIVTAGELLYDCNGWSMDTVSSEQHLLGVHNGETYMCLYNDSEWNNNISLYKLVCRAQRWLAAYNFHLLSGESIETFLPHGKIR